MTIYSGKNYRKVYESHFGKIPKDEFGRHYDIHHLDGNHSNISPDNLRAVTIKEHYDIHYGQGDWAACQAISMRLKMSPEEISRIAALAAQKRVTDGTHHFQGQQGAERNRKRNAEMLATGTHPFQGQQGAERNRKRNAEMLVAGTHPFSNSEKARERNLSQMAAGTHNFQKLWKCEHCGKQGKNTAVYARWHGNKCGLSPKKT